MAKDLFKCGLHVADSGTLIICAEQIIKSFHVERPTNSLPSWPGPLSKQRIIMESNNEASARKWIEDHINATIVATCKYIKLARALDNGVFVHPALVSFVHGRLTRRTTDIGRRRPRLRPAVNWQGKRRSSTAVWIANRVNIIRRERAFHVRLFRLKPNKKFKKNLAAPPCLLLANQ